MKYLVLDVGGTAIKHALMIEKLEKNHFNSIGNIYV